MPFEIIRNDITQVRADAIVNTANPYPVVGAGTDSAIHRAAGPKLLAAREMIGEIPVGCSAETLAYDLPAKYVLHTVSPAWIDGAHGEETLLRRAYDAALELADRLRCRSVAFPLLSAGSYGFPRERALSVALGAFTDFLLTHDVRIILVVFGQDTFSLAHGLFGDLKSYIDDHYVAEAEKAEYGESPALRRRRERAAFAAAMSFEGDAAAPVPAQSIHAPRKTALSGRAAMQNVARKDAREEALSADTDLETFLKKTESTFSEHLVDLLNECEEKDSCVYRRAEISRQLFHKIIHKKDYQPTKSTAIQLALGLRLNLAETQKLLGKAGYSLTRSSKADLVVQYFIEHREYSIVTINMALYDCGLPLLKTGSAV